MQEKLRVLIVDDSEIVSERIKRLLVESHYIHVIGEAMNSRSAMYLLHHKLPDAVLLDIRVNEERGAGLLSFLKRINIKVIVLSNCTEPYYRKLCMKSGADYFFDKSTEFEKIPEVLNAIFNSGIKEINMNENPNY